MEEGDRNGKLVDMEKDRRQNGCGEERGEVKGEDREGQ